MLKTLLALAVFLGLAFGVASVFGALGAEEARHREALHLIDEQRAAFEMAQAQERAVATQDARIGAETVGYAAQGAFAFLLPAGLVLVAILMVVEYRRRMRYFWPRSDGLLPVPREQLAAVSPVALAGFHQARMIAAQGAPHNLTIKEVPMQTQPVARSSLPVAPQVAAPQFAQLLEGGLTLSAGREFCLGYVDGQPLMGGWGDLYSSAVAGLSGSGKTTTLRFLACQAALGGARFAVLDPHGEAGEESLAHTLRHLLRQGDHLAVNMKHAPEMLRVVRAMLDARLHGGDKQGQPWMFCVDEFTALMGRDDIGPALAQLVEAIAQEGRKVGVYALISGQIWTADRAGGTALRDALASAYVHRMRPEQARRLLPNADARKAIDLAPGRALLARTSGEVIEVAIPKTTAEDVAKVAELVATQRAWGTATEPATLRLPPRAPEVAAEGAKVAASSRVAVDIEAIRAANLYLGGMTMSEVLFEMRGIKSNEGARYQKALGEIQDLARKGVAARLSE